MQRSAFLRGITVAVAFVLVILSAPLHAGELKDLRVLASEFPPYSFYAANQPHGVAVQKVQELFAKLGHFPDIEIYPWARAYSTVQNTPNAVLFSVARTPEREEMFAWIGTVIDFDVHIYRRADRDDIELVSENDFTKYSFAGLIKDVKTNYLKQHGVAVREVSNEEAALKMLNLGRVDLVALDKNAAEFRMLELGIDPKEFVSAYHVTTLSKPLYLIAHKDTDPELVKQLREALAELNADQGVRSVR